MRLVDETLIAHTLVQEAVPRSRAPLNSRRKPMHYETVSQRALRAGNWRK